MSDHRPACDGISSHQMRVEICLEFSGLVRAQDFKDVPVVT